MTLARLVDRDGRERAEPIDVPGSPPRTLYVPSGRLLHPDLPQLLEADEYRLRSRRWGHLATGRNELVYEFVRSGLG